LAPAQQFQLAHQQPIITSSFRSRLLLLLLLLSCWAVINWGTYCELTCFLAPVGAAAAAGAAATAAV